MCLHVLTQISLKLLERIRLGFLVICVFRVLIIKEFGRGGFAKVGVGVKNGLFAYFLNRTTRCGSSVASLL